DFNGTTAVHVGYSEGDVIKGTPNETFQLPSAVLSPKITRDSPCFNSARTLKVVEHNSETESTALGSSISVESLNLILLAIRGGLGCSFPSIVKDKQIFLSLFVSLFSRYARQG